MKIGVVSDTHGRGIPAQLINEFKGVELIIHAGDFCAAKDLKIFTDLKEVKAVYGNMDESALQKKLPEKIIFKLADCTVGVYHGEGPPQKILDAVRAEFKEDKIDAVVFGHSHIPFNKSIDGILFFNPGAPNDTVCAPYCSYGILEIDGKKISGKIIKVKDGYG